MSFYYSTAMKENVLWCKHYRTNNDIRHSFLIFCYGTALYWKPYFLRWYLLSLLTSITKTLIKSTILCYVTFQKQIHKYNVLILLTFLGLLKIIFIFFITNDWKCTLKYFNKRYNLSLFINTVWFISICFIYFVCYILYVLCSVILHPSNIYIYN